MRIMTIAVVCVVLLAILPSVLQAQETQTLSTPTIMADGKMSHVDISWTKVEGADHYVLYRWETDEGWMLLSDSLTDLAYADRNLSADKTYFYTVRAVANDGRISGWAENVNARISQLDAVSASISINSALESSPVGIMLDWPQVQGAGEYEIWVWDEDKKWEHAINLLASDCLWVDFCHHVHVPVKRGVHYYLAIRALPTEKQASKSEW